MDVNCQEKRHEEQTEEVIFAELITHTVESERSDPGVIVFKTFRPLYVVWKTNERFFIIFRKYQRDKTKRKNFIKSARFESLS